MKTLQVICPGQPKPTFTLPFKAGQKVLINRCGDQRKERFWQRGHTQEGIYQGPGARPGLALVAVEFRLPTQERLAWFRGHDPKKYAEWETKWIRCSKPVSWLLQEAENLWYHEDLPRRTVVMSIPAIHLQDNSDAIETPKRSARTSPKHAHAQRIAKGFRMQPYHRVRTNTVSEIRAWREGGPSEPDFFASLARLYDGLEAPALIISENPRAESLHTMYTARAVPFVSRVVALVDAVTPQACAHGMRFDHLALRQFVEEVGNFVTRWHALYRGRSWEGSNGLLGLGLLWCPESAEEKLTTDDLLCLTRGLHLWVENSRRKC